MPELKLFLFGPPRVEFNGTPVDIQRRKALAMLIYLAITGQPHSRDALAALFYPDHSQSQSRTYLRRDLALLNTGLSGDWLAVDRETVELKHEQPAFWLDVAHFRQLLAACQSHKHDPKRPCADCLARQAEAVMLYTGDFLAGFSLRDCPDFDDWQFFQNESLRRELAAVLEQLVDGFSRQNQPELAIPHARRWVGLDPLHEPAQRALIQLYDQTGQLAAALRQYEEYAELLEAEFGLPPEEETATLYEAIKAKRMLGPFLRAETQKGIEAAAQKEFDSPVDNQPPANPQPPKDKPIYDREPKRHDRVQELPAEPFSMVGQPAALASAAPYTGQSVPLIGRTRELELLQRKIQAARQGQGSVVLLAGDSGVGKTRLAHEAVHAAAMTGMAILAGAAYEQESHLPYQPFIEAFDRYLAEQNRPPEHHPISHYKPVRTGDLQQEHAALFKATASFLTALAAHQPVILLLDDLHAADEASLSLFHYLARQARAAPLILLATYRTDLLIPPMSPFGRLLNGLYREHFSETLHLPQLAEQDTAQIISYILSGAASPALAQSVFDITEGNPFFIQEIIQAMFKADQLQQEAGQWRLRPGVSLAAPAQLQDLLRERIQRLGSTVEPALSAAAVIGREFRFSVLAAVTSLAETELLDVMDTALEGNLLEEIGDGYRFRHALIRQTLYDGLSQARRAWLHTRTAEAIEALHGGRPEALRPHVEALAFHYRQSNSRDRALPYLMEAGQKAIESYAVEVALNYFKEALALMDELGLDDRAQRWQTLRRLGWCAYVLADTLQAVTCLEQALALAPTEEWQPSARDRLQLHLSAAFALTTAGDMEAAIRHLHAAMAEVGETGGGSAEYAHLLYQVALQHWHQDEYQEALEVARWSLEVANPLNDREAMARAYEILALSAHSLGDWQQGLNFEERRARLVGPNPDVSSAFDAHL
jgi:DNA-binding SARP family transcriptional activator